MGANTAVTVKNRRMADLLSQSDLPLLLVVATLLIFGLVMLYSASWDFSLQIYSSPTHIFQRQVLWLAIGLVSMTVCVLLPYRAWRRLALPAMAVTLIALALVFILGEIRLGAVRNLQNGSVQPSELAKLVTILYLAVWLDSRQEHINDWTLALIPLGTILGLIGGLIFLQPDLSAALTIFLLGGLLYFLAGGDWRRILTLVAGAALVGTVVVALSPTGRERVQSYLENLHDPLTGSYHVQRSMEAFARGGWFGRGIGKSATKLTGLPVPPTDSIFAVIGEETGFFGASLVVILYVLLVWRCLVIARKAPDAIGQIIAAGIGCWLGMEALINMAVMVGLMPFAGNALPLISAGGSNLVVSLTSIGILCSIVRTSAQEQQIRERSRYAVVDLRRRDRRRRVSGAGRPASPEKP
ncbi:MAG: stage V sporulation protein E [Anaerolineales bacterium]